MCMMLEMTYFHAELVQLIVSRTDSEPKVQRYGMKKNTVTVDPIMLQDELWMKQREKPPPNRRSRFFENWTAETEFLVFEIWILSSVRFGSAFRKPISDIFIGFRTPLVCVYVCKAFQKLWTDFVDIFEGVGRGSTVQEPTDQTWWQTSSPSPILPQVFALIMHFQSDSNSLQFGRDTLLTNSNVRRT